MRKRMSCLRIIPFQFGTIIEIRSSKNLAIYRERVFQANLFLAFWKGSKYYGWILIDLIGIIYFWLMAELVAFVAPVEAAALAELVGLVAVVVLAELVGGVALVGLAA